MKKILLPLLVVIILLVGVGTSAQNTVTVTVTGHFECIEGLFAEMAAYEDWECTIPLSDFDMEQIEQGTNAEYTFWLKNTGGIDFINVDTSGASTPGYNVAVLTDDFALVVGEVMPIVVNVNVPDTLAGGVYSFEVFLVANDA